MNDSHESHDSHDSHGDNHDSHNSHGHDAHDDHDSHGSHAKLHQELSHHINHHILKNELIKDCYCGSHLQDWKSEFFMHFHYKTCICKDCHRKNRVSVSFIGSGLDDWERLRNHKETIEVIVKKAQPAHHDDHGGGH